MPSQSDLFAVQPVPRICDCWIGNGVVLCEIADALQRMQGGTA